MLQPLTCGIPTVVDRFIYDESFYDDYADGAWSPDVLEPEDVAASLYFLRTSFLTSETFLQCKETTGYIVSCVCQDEVHRAFMDLSRDQVSPMVQELTENGAMYLGVLHISDGKPLPTSNGKSSPGTKKMNLF